MVLVIVVFGARSQAFAQVCQLPRPPTIEAVRDRVRVFGGNYTLRAFTANVTPADLQAMNIGQLDGRVCQVLDQDPSFVEDRGIVLSWTPSVAANTFHGPLNPQATIACAVSCTDCGPSQLPGVDPTLVYHSEEPCTDSTCGACFPLAEVPKTRVPGYRELSQTWQQVPGTESWTKTFAATSPNSYQDVGSKLTDHYEREASLTWESLGNMTVGGGSCLVTESIGVLGTHTREVKQELKVALFAKMLAGDATVTWSKVCGAVCNNSVPKDYWVMKISQPIAWRTTEKNQFWEASRHTKNIVVDRACYPMWWGTHFPGSPWAPWDDAAPPGWYGGTNLIGAGGARYQEGGGSPPPKDDVWDPTGRTGAGSVVAVRYKVFAEVPDQEELVQVDDSEILPACLATPATADPPVNGAEQRYDSLGGTCDRTYSVATGPTIYCTNTSPATPITTGDFVSEDMWFLRSTAVVFGWNLPWWICRATRVKSVEETSTCHISAGPGTYEIAAPTLSVAIEKP